MLAACRSLASAGYDVAAASYTSLAPTQWSRTCRWRPHVVDPRANAEEFVEQLRRLLCRRRYATLIAGSDSALLAISRGRERLRKLTVLGLPTHAVVERVLNRTQLAQASRAAGLGTIGSTCCTSLAEALDAAATLEFPLVLKSTDAAIADPHVVSGAPKGRVVRDLAELRREAREFPTGMLLQPLVPGTPVSFAGVSTEGGGLLAVAMARYLRMWPPSGGSVTFAETVAAPAALEQHVSRLLAVLGWQGIFELELIQTVKPHDSATSGGIEFVPIDFNPRPYGSLELAAAAGAPLATIWCDWLLQRDAQGKGDLDQQGPRQPARARPGLRYRWEDGELRHAWRQLRDRRVRAALACLRPQRRVAHAHFRGSDPLPLLARGLYLGQRLAGG